MLFRYKIHRLKDSFKKDFLKISKMKLLGAIIAVAAASTAISNNEKKFCYCCLDGFQWYCCTACLLGGGSGGDDKAQVADALKNIQVILKNNCFTGI